MVIPGILMACFVALSASSFPFTPICANMEFTQFDIILPKTSVSSFLFFSMGFNVINLLGICWIAS